MVNPSVTAISIVTLLLLGSATAFPRLWPLTSVIIIMWTECVVLARLLFQLDLINPWLDASLWEWIGLSKVSPGRHPGNYVQWEIYVVVACAIERSARKQGNLLWPNVSKEARMLFEDTGTGIVAGLKLRINHMVSMYGEQICFCAMVVAMVVRRNVVSLLYFGCLLVMARAGSTQRSRLSWRLQLLVVLLAMLYEVGCALGMPPEVTYPYQEASYPLRVLYRWLFLPPNTADGAPMFWNLPRAPHVWLSSTALYLDFCVLFVHSLILRVHGKGKQWSPEPNMMSAKIALWTLSWSACFLCFLVVLTRVDVFCLGYCVAGYYFLLHFNYYLANSHVHRLFWKRLLLYSLLVVFFHVLWVLPALIIDWDGVNQNLLIIVELFGVRYGQGMPLRDGDPVVGVTALASGLAVDVVLVVVVFCLRRILDGDEVALYATEVKERAESAVLRAKVCQLPRTCATVQALALKPLTCFRCLTVYCEHEWLALAFFLLLHCLLALGRCSSQLTCARITSLP